MSNVAEVSEGSGSASESTVPYQLVEHLYRQGLELADQRSYAKARDALSRMLGLLKSERLDLQAEVHLWLSSLAEQVSDFEASLLHFKKYYAIQRLRCSCEALHTAQATLGSHQYDSLVEEMKELLVRYLPNSSDLQLREFFAIVAKVYLLSKSELRVCACLRFNLSTKEIADVLSVSVRTVDSHRLSIRKKMRLPQSVNLSTYLQSFP